MWSLNPVYATSQQCVLRITELYLVHTFASLFSPPLLFYILFETGLIQRHDMTHAQKKLKAPESEMEVLHSPTNACKF